MDQYAGQITATSHLGPQKGYLISGKSRLVNYYNRIIMYENSQLSHRQGGLNRLFFSKYFLNVKGMISL